jgi:hypothetical protein
MIHDHPPLSPFERRVIGYKGAILLRRDTDHADRCRKAIARRNHPAWSQMRVEIRISEAA